MTRVLACMTAPNSPDELEHQFYESLRRGQVDSLMALWADEDDTLCVHPGGPRMVGAAAIRASFEALFAHGGLPVRAEQVHRVHTATTAVHSVLEHLDVVSEQGPQSAWVVATNIYVLTAQGWRLLAHHASPADPHDVSASHRNTVVLH